MATQTPPVLTADSLFGFLDHLRGCGYLVGTRQYILVQDLLATLLADSGSVDGELFASALAPVLAKSPLQQVEFRKRFDRWFYHPPTEAPPKPDEAALPAAKERANDLERLLRGATRGGRLLLLILFVVGIVSGILYWSRRPAAPRPPVPPRYHEQPIQNQSPGPATAEVTWELVKSHPWTIIEVTGETALFFAILGAGWVVWWRVRAVRFLKRQTVTAAPDLTAIRVQTDDAELLSTGTVYSIAKGLRRRVVVASNDIAVAETVRKTSATGGEFTAVYGTRRVVPEYLFLVERQSQSDEFARLAAEVAARVDRGDHVITVFYFSQDPDVLFPARPGDSPLPLDEVASRYAHCRLVVFADAANTTRGTPEATRRRLEAFASWDARFWVTPVGLEGRVPQERALTGFFQTFPASEAGLTDLGRAFDLERRLRGNGNRPVPLELTQLVSRPERWMRRMPAPERQISDLVLSLRNSLGESGFYWLCACAAYPEIHRQLTLYLGRRLHGPDGEAIFNPDLYLQLMRLPWFREGWMPEWLREKLIAELPPPRASQVRELLEGLLLSSLRGEISELELRVAQKQPAAVSRLLKGIVPKLSRSAPPDSALADTVFISFLTGRTAVPLPRAVWNLMRTGTINGKAASVGPAPARVRIIGRLSLALVDICWFTGIAFVVASTIIAEVYLLYVPVLAALTVMLAGGPLIWCAWRCSSQIVLRAALVAFTTPALAALLALFGSLSSLACWVAVGVGISLLVLLRPARQACSYISARTSRPTLSVLPLRIALAAISVAFFTICAACIWPGWLDLVPSPLDYVTFILIIASPVFMGAPTVIIALRQRSGIAYLAGATILSGYISCPVLIVLVGLLSRWNSDVGLRWGCFLYAVIGLALAVVALRRSKASSKDALEIAK